MNKKELIKEVKEVGIYGLNIFGTVVEGVPTKTAIKLIEQLDETQKVTIPQFVADWIEECEEKEKTLLNSLLYTPEGVNSWVGNSDNQELFARAWIEGYEVEKEKQYIVKLKNGQPLVKALLGGKFYFNQNITAGNYKATRKELEEAGFGWVFDCEGIEVQEVE